MNHYYDPFKLMLLPLIKSGARVLDIGAGDCIFSGQLAVKGAHVTAFDKRFPKNVPPGVNFTRLTVEEWVTSSPPETYDAILILDVIPFLPREWVLGTLLPFCKNRLNFGGLLIIEAFTKKSDPPFKITSTYQREDFYELRLDPLYQTDGIYRGPGVDGIEREWFFVQYIGKRL